MAALLGVYGNNSNTISTSGDMWAESYNMWVGSCDVWVETCDIWVESCEGWCSNRSGMHRNSRLNFPPLTESRSAPGLWYLLRHW